MNDPVAAPIVSVVIPAYNGASLIGETLASLGEQTLTAWEALVVDDCSSDDTRDLVRNWPDPRVRLIENAVNGGPVNTRNRGFAEARGRYLAAFQYSFTVPGVMAPAVVALFAVAVWLPWLLVGAAAGLAVLALRGLAGQLPAAALRPGSARPDDQAGPSAAAA